MKRDIRQPVLLNRLVVSCMTGLFLAAGLSAQQRILSIGSARPEEISFVFVPGGTFEMGDLWDAGFSDDEKPIHSVTVGSFWMSRYEITNGAFCVFLNERGNPVEGGVPWIDTGDRDCLIQEIMGRFIPRKGFEDHPVVEVSWWGARAFAAWLGCRLPTEAEWEYAARAGGRTIMFPNGDLLTFDDANISGIGGRDTWKQTSPVGSFPANPLGIYDMAGNVWERCEDWYGENYYKKSPGENPAGPDTGMYRIIRGGSWDYSRWNCRASTRGMYKPDGTTADIGFRIVRDPAGEMNAPF